MNTECVIAGSADIGEIVNGPVPGMLKSIVSTACPLVGIHLGDRPPQRARLGVVERVGHGEGREQRPLLESLEMPHQVRLDSPACSAPRRPEISRRRSVWRRFLNVSDIFRSSQSSSESSATPISHRRTRSRVLSRSAHPDRSENPLPSQSLPPAARPLIARGKYQQTPKLPDTESEKTRCDLRHRHSASRNGSDSHLSSNLARPRATNVGSHQCHARQSLRHRTEAQRPPKEFGKATKFRGEVLTNSAEILAQPVTVQLHLAIVSIRLRFIPLHNSSLEHRTTVLHGVFFQHEGTVRARTRMT